MVASTVTLEFAMRWYLVPLRVLGLHRPIGSRLEVAYGIGILLSLSLVVVLGIQKYFTAFYFYQHRDESNSATSVFVHVLTALQVCFVSAYFIKFNANHVAEYYNLLTEFAKVGNSLNVELALHYGKTCKKYAIIVFTVTAVVFGKYLLLWGSIFKFNDATASLITKILHFLLEGKFVLFVMGKHFLFQSINEQLKNVVDSSHLETLRICHSRLCSLVRDVTSLFEAALTCSLAITFLDTLRSLYFFCIAYYHPPRVILPWRRILALDAASGAIFGLCRVINLTWRCHTTCSEAKQTRFILHRLEFEMLDPIVRSEILMFREQLLHSTDTRYCLFSTFTLDRATIYALVTAFATNLVLLIQFHTLRTSLHD